MSSNYPFYRWQSVVKYIKTVRAEEERERRLEVPQYNVVLRDVAAHSAHPEAREGFSTKGFIYSTTPQMKNKHSNFWIRSHALAN